MAIHTLKTSFLEIESEDKARTMGAEKTKAASDDEIDIENTEDFKPRGSWKNYFLPGYASAKSVQPWTCGIRKHNKIEKCQWSTSNKGQIPTVEYLQSKSSYTKLKQFRKIPRLKVVALRINEISSAMDKIAKKNNRFKYLLVTVDGLSR